MHGSRTMTHRHVKKNLTPLGTKDGKAISMQSTMHACVHSVSGGHKGQAHLYFDGAYKRKEGRATVGMVVLNPIKEKVMEIGIELLNVSTNNEAEYYALIEGLEWCVSNDINCLNKELTSTTTLAFEGDRASLFALL